MDIIKVLFVFGALYHLAFAIFHMFFWKLFNWKEELRLMTFRNRGILQIQNICLIVLFLGLAIMPILSLNDLYETRLWKFLLLFISLFWFVRMICQYFFYKLSTSLSRVFFVIFFLGFLNYLILFILVIQGYGLMID